MSGYSPLSLHDLPRKQRSIAETVLAYIPVVGWIIASHLYWLRVRPQMASLNRQVSARTNRPSQSVWGESQLQQEIGALVCRLAAKHFGWPNDHFIPSDPVELVFFEDDGEGISLMMELEQSLSVPDGTLRTGIYDQIWGLNLGELVGLLVSVRNKHC